MIIWIGIKKGQNMAKKTNTDEVVMSLLKKVQEKKQEIEKASKTPKWKTNCTLKMQSDPGRQENNLHILAIRDVEKLMEIYSYLLQREDYLQKAAQELDVIYDPVYMGYTIADWKEDLKFRMSQLNIQKRKQELEELDKRVNGLISVEQRREMEVKALQELLEE